MVFEIQRRPRYAIAELCCLTFELSGRQRHGALDSKRKMGRRPALDGQRDMPLALRLSEGLGSTGAAMNRVKVQLLQKTETHKSEQQGMMYLYAGAILALRNPRAHELLADHPERAIEHLSFLSMLAKALDRASKP